LRGLAASRRLLRNAKPTRASAPGHPIEHDHLGDALASGLVTAPLAGFKALGEVGKITVVQAFKTVAAAEAQHVVVEGAAAGVDALVDGAVEVATAEHGTKEGPEPTDGGFKPDELEPPVYDDGTQPPGPNLQV
jgi:hypothetical protein